MWVKICANTNAEDALAAAEFGADAVGFVFAPSKRQVTAEQVRAISAVMPDGVERVGVFGDVAAEEIAAVVETAGLNAVQLHGGFRGGLTKRLGELLRSDVAIIHTLPWDVEGDASLDVGSRLDEIVEFDPRARVLMDAKVNGATGGTGIAYDWASAGRLVARYRDRSLRIVVAGGLRPDNVAEAIGLISPWGVDVASGVESTPGKKDLRKLKAFIENARGA